MPDLPFRIERRERDAGLELGLHGVLRMEHADALLRQLEQTTDGAAGPLRIDLHEVERADGASVALILAFCSERDARCELVGAREEVERLLTLYRRGEPRIHYVEDRRRGLLEELGIATVEHALVAKRVLGFTGHLAAATARTIRRPSSVHWLDVPLLAERAGADGVPIVALINFLIGLIMAYQSAIQLERFGADVFLADLVGLSITRELAPLMTAVIVAGRSGAAYAAELGTMQVREEIDALRTLGLDPIRFLVFPRILALALMVPLLTLLGDFVGCLGGLLVGITQLDLSMTAYLHELRTAVDLWDIGGGLIKSAVFAGAIALISCQRGLATSGSAAGVGASTTSAVVVILFALVSLDAVFAVVYDALGI